MTPNQMLPTLPSLGRPSWAPKGMSAETIADIQSRPDQLRRYRSGASRQINFTGSLMPQPPAGDTSGVVYAGGQPPDAGGYVPANGIPGTARPTTPVVPGQSYGEDVVQQQEPVAKTPWFQNPWTQPYEEDAPWWMKGQNGRS